MDFELSEDQVALCDGIRDLCQGRFDIDTVRGLADCGGVDRQLWSELADTGVFSLVVPEDEGGVGLGWAEAGLVFEQLGRALVPGPLVGTLLAAEVIDDAVVGFMERPYGPALVEYPEVIDALLVLDRNGVWRVDASELSVEAAQSVDPLTPVGRVDLLPQGEQLMDFCYGWANRAVFLNSALQVGLATGARELAVAYAQERQQFGKPIGQFQAIKHKCADMYSREEVARAALYYAGCVMDVTHGPGLPADPGGYLYFEGCTIELGDTLGDREHQELVRAVSGARILAAEAADHNGKDCVQVHGGMGFTWEIDAHLYLKRAWALTPQFGSLDRHADRIANLVGADPLGHAAPLG
ncbi:MAG: acyl-CoA dehydrogenase [Acidimicrobiia bacterium]|nr:acyl-CoA dehydrogenase [Acidimicrobiia bacterium]MXZ86294.1 acyl-CoA dehydrogenase [Acidimicrobiia bacterium]MYB10707.1 acyl-CoA dehydrogenase [Acidimicrobiia bacterium]MYB72980.1 acyl-CoA dehydrogenase [Acidimicrobiia bacterium]MYG58186.1 acyl-CoA dehydrogenase [Acidimicrobiia bacterium]